MVRSTLFQEGRTVEYLKVKWVAYLATISLGSLHPASDRWMGVARVRTNAVKYAKRIPEIAAVFGLAHLSTFYFEDF
jgi:hypothetical protein